MNARKISAPGWVVLSTALGWAVFLSAAAALSGCDVPPAELPIEAAEPASAPVPCSDDLRDIVEAKAETLACHAECADLMLACLDEPSPSCWSCEHEAAICRSTCPDSGLLWTVL